jgi:hypothetical protein
MLNGAHSFFKMFQSRCTASGDAMMRENDAAVRLSLGPPQWPDAVPARYARMNI